MITVFSNIILRYCYFFTTCKLCPFDHVSEKRKYILLSEIILDDVKIDSHDSIAKVSTFVRKPSSVLGLNRPVAKF